MASTGQKLLLVAFFICSTAQISSFDLSSYLVSVIEHLAEVEPGTVKCVFYGLSSQHPFDNELKTVLRSPRLHFVTKYVLSGESTLDYTQLPQEPTLVLIQGSNVVPFSEAIVRTLVIFNPGTKVVVLVNTATIDYQAYLSLLGLYLKFRNAVLLDKVNMKVVKSQAVELKIGRYFPEPSRLFKSCLKYNLRGTALTYSSETLLVSSDVTFRWINETASYLNGSLVQIEHECEKFSTYLENDCYNQHLIENEVQIDTTQKYCHAVNMQNQQLLYTTITDELVVVVPRFPIGSIQLFTLPFDPIVWIVLTLLLATMQLVKCLFPSVFRNDPILLILCGFERFSLHKAGFLEKSVLNSLILLMFFMTCAYETKIISLMISKPAAVEIETMQDLLESGVNIKANLLSMPYLANHSLLGPIVYNNTNLEQKMDLNHAYVRFRFSVEAAIPLYYDSDNKLYRYKIMDQPLNMEVRVYRFSWRYPLMDSFAHTLTVFVESGLQTYWVEKDMKKEWRKRPGSSCFLTFEDIFPILTVTWYGYALGVIIFFGEFFKHTFQLKFKKSVLQCIKQ